MDAIKSYQRNHSNVISLLEMSQNENITDQNDLQSLYRSSVVLSVAYWQNFHESIIIELAKLIKKRCTSSTDIPREVRKKTAKWVMLSEEIDKHPHKAEVTIWEFADGEWSDYYFNFVKEKVERLNTPNTQNLNKLYSRAFGIENLSSDWTVGIDDKLPACSVDDILKTRHEIVHGVYDDILNYDEVKDAAECLFENGLITKEVAQERAVDIMVASGTEYSLDMFKLRELIVWLYENQDDMPFRVAELSDIERQWYSNHRKFSHTAWNLLEGGSNSRATTCDFDDFIEGNIQIPYEIISFDGVDSIQKPETRMISLDDLVDEIDNNV